MLSKKPWLRITLVVLLIGVIAVVSGAVGYRVGVSRLAARTDLQMPMRGEFQNNGGFPGGFGERDGFLPRSSAFFFGSRLLTGALPGLLLGIVVLVALAVALDRLIFWPKAAVEANAKAAAPEPKKRTLAKSK